MAGWADDLALMLNGELDHRLADSLKYQYRGRFEDDMLKHRKRNDAFSEKWAKEAIQIQLKKSASFLGFHALSCYLAGGIKEGDRYSKMAIDRLKQIAQYDNSIKKEG